ncbi:MAG: RNA 2',3'-cyclic phosphodiesterase [Candidatus Cloacimonetes bacterium]|nr:RNA 2',3'-cyclic phosphodiesterase [Candidatus Cloacimonadota bacterium]
MRAFLAFQLPDNIREELSQLIDKGKNLVPKGIKWVREENLHITLLFLGDIERSQLKQMDRVFSKIFGGLQPFTINSPIIETIPAREPRIIWVRYRTNVRKIFSLPGSIRNAFPKLGLETKPLKLHVTLGRVRSNAENIPFGKIISLDMPKQNTIIDTVGLFESKLKPDGPVYHLLQQYELKGYKEDDNG